MRPPPAALLRHSPLESARFGLRVFRAEADTVDAGAIAAEIGREEIDVAIVRMPARALTPALEGLRRCGFAPIVADTLVAYGRELAAADEVPGDKRLVLRSAQSGDAGLLASMARSIFADYATHFHANPWFAHDRILDGYAEWAARHAQARDGSAAWLVEHEGALAGFSCYGIDGASGTATGVLNGILPDSRRRGAYRAMLEAMLTDFSASGLQRFRIATQAHNAAVRGVWTSLGLALERESHTVHINARHDRNA
jgi:ribosomal protein S18 acetylase RimI-like enzyme